MPDDIPDDMRDDMRISGGRRPAHRDRRAQINCQSVEAD
jgi:hypothetical protein